MTTPNQSSAKKVDAWFRRPTFATPYSFWRQMRRPHWEDFFDDTAHEIFKRGGEIVDIGGGLRLDGTRGDREKPDVRRKFGAYFSDPAVHFIVTDYTDHYHPDRVEDIHQLSFETSSLDGLFCVAVLEHVYDPKKAAEELSRVLRPGGVGLIYMPFIYRYHSVVTSDYYDYFRASSDGLAYLFRDCASVTVCPVRGVFETLLFFLPIQRLPFLKTLCRALDWGSAPMRNVSQRQTSGFFVRIVR